MSLREKEAPADVRREADDAPLIPEHIVDEASQRLFVVSMFVLIQCWKIYDILLVKADAYALQSGGVDSTDTFTLLNSFTFVLKFAVVDGLFLWLLPVLNIPLLTFLPLVTVLLTVVVNAGTFLLASNSALPLLSGVFVPLWNAVFRQKELTIMGDSVSPTSVIDVNAHFKGRYTIQYLPEASVNLNPFGYSSFCLEATSSPQSTFPLVIRLPIEFNTTNDVGFMQLQYTSPENAVLLLNYTAHDIQKLQRRDYSHLAKYPAYAPGDQVFYIEVEVAKPGSYKIHRVVDTDGLVIRPYKSDFTVGHCPTAKFVYPGVEEVYTGYKCFSGHNDADWNLPLITSFGVYPINVELATYHEGKRLSAFNATITSDLDSPEKGLLWLRSSHITRNVLEQQLLRNPSLFKVNQPGKYDFRIVSVSDKSELRRAYNPASHDKEVDFVLDLKKSPEIILSDTQPNSPLLINHLKRLHLHSKDKVTFPLTLTVLFKSERGDALSSTNYTFNNWEEYQRGLHVSEPGTYSLRSGQDRYCPCTVKESAQVAVMRPEPPTVKITGEPIKDKCVGTVGFEFDIKFDGQAPFEVQYEVFKNVSGVLKPVLNERGMKQHQRSSNSPTYKFQYKPLQEGSYVLVFKSIKDAYYKHPVSIPEADNTFSTFFRQRSRYTFHKGGEGTRREIDVCKGNKAKIPVYLEGNFPFSFQYKIVDIKSGKVQESRQIKDYFENSYQIESFEFQSGGQFKIVLENVIDHLGCPAETNQAELVQINARKEVPLIGFKKSETYKIIEGSSVKIPFDLVSSIGLSSQDKITYSVTDIRDPNISKQYVLTGASEFRVKKEGIYRLELYESKGCPGVVDNKLAAVTVLYYPKPSLTVVPNENQISVKSNEQIVLNSICQETSDGLKLTLEGKKPFTVLYNIKYPSGKLQSSHISIDNNEVTLPLLSKQKGTYEYSFPAIYDSLYTKEKMVSGSRINAPAVAYTVRGAPNLRVEEPYIQICESQVTDDISLRIPVAFDGQFPFTVKGTIKHENGKAEKFTLSQIVESHIALDDIAKQSLQKQMLLVGEHMIEFEEVTDAFSCNRQKMTENNRVMLSVTKVPTITKLKARNYYCVGDHISYNMSGISPFTVYYNFNGQYRKAEVGHEFLRLAAKPGQLAIVALQDSSASLCLVNFTRNEAEYKSLALDVYDLPSVEISQGDSIIKNLHEGDQTEITFRFTGVAPFEVTYVRTLGDEGDRRKRKGAKSRGKRQVVETVSVDNIWDHEYVAVVSLEGTYEAIRVADAYCQATRSVEDILRT